MNNWQDPIFETSEDREKTRPGSLVNSRKGSISDMIFAGSKEITATPRLKLVDRAIIRDRNAFANPESKIILSL